MPGMIGLGRRWALGSDDLVVPSVACFSVHAVQLTWLLVLIRTHRTFREDTYLMHLFHTDGCSYLYHLFVPMELWMRTCQLAACFLTAAWSLRGGITRPKRRRSVKLGIVVYAVVLLLSVLWDSAALFAFYFPNDTCDVRPESKVGVLVSVGGDVLVVVSLTVTALLVYDSSGDEFARLQLLTAQLGKPGQPAKHGWDLVRHHVMARQKRTAIARMRVQSRRRWNARMRSALCCLHTADSGHDKNAVKVSNPYSEAAEAFYQLFTDCDIVPTDLLAGLIMLQRDQEARQQIQVNKLDSPVLEYLSGIPVTSHNDEGFIDLSHRGRAQRFAQVAYYSKYAIAAYGFASEALLYRHRALSKVCTGCNCCCLPARCLPRLAGDVHEQEGVQPVILDTGCCSCDFLALTRVLARLIPDQIEIVYVNQEGAFCHSPFFIALDHSQQTVVVSIRGSLSLVDVVTDASCIAVPFPSADFPDSWKAHKGFLIGALAILNKLRRQKLLERALALAARETGRKYRIVLTGHSLGSCLAAILGLLLRKDYPDVMVYSISPAGGAVSKEVAKEMKTFVTSLTVGSDLVMRVGISQAVLLRKQVLDVLRRSKTPKWFIIPSIFTPCYHPVPEIPEEVLVEEDSAKTHVMLAATTVRQDENLKIRKIGFGETAMRLWLEKDASAIHDVLVPPGYIYHIVYREVGGVLGVGAKREYLLRRAEPEDFQELLISRAMTEDHLMDRVNEAVDGISARLERNLRISFMIHTNSQQADSHV